MDVNSVIKMANGKKAVFFDYFDTIVRRTVAPEHIKRLWARFLIYSLNINITPKELYQLRAKLEAELCINSESDGDDREFQIKELYNLIHQELELKSEFSAFYDLALNLELDLEKKHQELNQDVLDVISQIDKHISLYVVSDFYMSADNLTELLSKHGLLERFSGVFSSSDFKRTKASGKIFPILLDKLSLQPQDILHIGDNKVSDHESPRKFGIDAIHINRDYSEYDRSWKLHASENSFYREINQLMGDSGKSFSWFLFAIYVFVYKLYAYHKSRENKVIFFLAREGFLLKELFETYLKSIGEYDLFTCVYLEVSRKATYLPSLRSLDQENFDSLFGQYRKMSALTFLKSISLEQELTPILGAKFDLNEVHEDFPTSEVYIYIKADQNVASIFERARLKSIENFRNYFESLTSESSDEIHLVDVGWKGTIQNNLHRIFKGNKRLVGHYLGLQLNTKETSSNRKIGYLFDLRKDEVDSRRSVFFETTALFEALLSAPTYSVSHYSVRGPEFFVAEKEKELYEKVYADLQSDFLSLFSEIIEIHNKYSVSTLAVENVAAKIYFDGVFSPSDSEVNVFSKLEHFENFGVFEYSSLKSIKSPFRTFWEFLKSPRHFVGAQWWPAYSFKQSRLGFLLALYRRYRSYKFIKSKRLNSDTTGTSENSVITIEMERVIENQTKMIDERDQYIRELEFRVKEFEVAVKSQDRLIKERDDYIKVLEERLNNR